MAVIDGRDAVEILCNTEKEEKDDLLLAFSKAFLTQQLQNGDMYYMWSVARVTIDVEYDSVARVWFF